MASVVGYEALLRRLAAIDPKKGFGVAFMKDLGMHAVAEAKGLVPRQTGNLQHSIRLGPVSETSAQIMAGGSGGVGYARYVEFGTKGGAVITPKNARVLAWGGARRLSGNLKSGAGATHFAMRVIRGATRAKPYLVPGAKLSLTKTGIGDKIVAAWNDAA